MNETSESFERKGTFIGGMDVESLREFKPGPIQKLGEIQSTKITLVSFTGGAYKKIEHIKWKHSQWIHFTKADGKQIHVNPDNVDYLEDL